MNGKGFGFVAVLIAIIAAGVYFFVGDLNAVPVQDVVRKDDGVVDTASTTLGVDMYDTSEYIRIEHVYARGTHTLIGEIPLPTPCHVLDSSTMIAESFPEQVTVNFVATTASEMCAQVITPEPFQVSFEASANALIRLTLNGDALKYIVTDSEVVETPLQESGVDEGASATSSDIDDMTEAVENITDDTPTSSSEDETQ
jgi:hypothetical protein